MRKHNKNTHDPPSQEKTSPGKSASVFNFLERAFYVYLPPYKMEHVFIVTGLLLSLIFDMGFPLSLKFLIDYAITPGNTRMLTLILGGLGLGFLLSGFGDLMQAYFCGRIASKLKRALRLKMFEKLMELPSGYYLHNPHGAIVSLFSREMFIVRDELKFLVSRGVMYSLQLLISVSSLFILAPRMTLMLFLLWLPLAKIVPKLVAVHASRADYRDKLKDAEVAAEVQENITIHEVVRVFNLQEREMNKFRAVVGDDPEGLRAKFRKGLTSATGLKGIFIALTEIEQELLLATAVAIGSYLTTHGALTVGTFSSFILMLLKASRAITDLSKFFSSLIAGASSMERIDKFFYEPPAVKDIRNPLTLPRFSREIQFRYVSFNYEGQRHTKQIIDRVVFTILAGESVAIVGRSGSGKSTILNLLMRFYDPTSGHITIDGYDLRKVSQGSLRAQMGVVMQNSVMINDTIRANIQLAKSNATEDEIIRAARAAEIHSVIMALPDGYDTLLGRHGVRLSKGQRQRITMARAILHNPPILLLDEVTSALDPEVEASINETVRKLAHHHTVISVTHRLATVADMDRVLVMDQGKVVEQGSPQELLDQKGLYYQLWRMQSGFNLSSDGRKAEVSAERLRDIPLFKNLEDDELKKLSKKCVTEYYDIGQYLVEEGEPGENFYIIVRGEVEVTTAGFDDHPVQVGMLQDGDYFGEIALLEGNLQPASVQARQPTSVLALKHKHFKKLLNKTDNIREAVEETALERNLDMLIGRGRRTSSVSALDDLIGEV